VGTSLQRIGNLVFIEGFIITPIGIVVGTIMGYLLALYIIITRASDVFEGISLDLRFSWIGVVIGAFMLIVVVFLVSLLTIRHINKIGIADVTRERTV
jgi:ABC-type antimicrobial peptide transport system permease subunit